MTLREIFSSISSFFGRLWSRLLDSNLTDLFYDLLALLGGGMMLIAPPFVIYALLKAKHTGGKRIGAIIMSVIMFCIWMVFINLSIKTLD